MRASPLLLLLALALVAALAPVVSAADPAPKPLTPAQAQARAQAEAFVRAHTARVPAEDIDGYLSDFVEGHPTIPVLRAHLTRAFADFDFAVELESFTILKTLNQTATLKVVQRTERTASNGAKLVERAEIQYFLRRPRADAPWRIEHTTRKRLDDSTSPKGSP